VWLSNEQAYLQCLDPCEITGGRHGDFQGGIEKIIKRRIGNKLTCEDAHYTNDAKIIQIIW